jgi:hypothetical protein
MTNSADDQSTEATIEKFYEEYIARTEELRAAIQRQDWGDVRRFVAWREERLTQLPTLPMRAGGLNALHQEYLSRIMVLEAANIASINETMDSIKTLIRKTQEHTLMVRYEAQA